MNNPPPYRRRQEAESGRDRRPLTATRRPRPADCWARPWLRPGGRRPCVEVEATAGFPTALAGRRLTLVPGAQRAQHRDDGARRPALHLPQPRHPRLRKRGLRPGRNRRRGPASSRGDHRRDRDGATAQGHSRTRLGAGARAGEPLCSALGIAMADNGIDLFDPSSEVRLELVGATDGARTTRRCQ